jgi:hypothetical protein
MRLLLLIAALALSACGKNDQTGATQNVDEGLTAENIVSNDVTAIDAVTGDAANMAADVDYSEFLNSIGNQPETNVAPPSKPTARISRPAENTAANAAANTAANTAVNSTE